MLRQVRIAGVVACIAAGAAISWPVAAQYAKPEDAVKYRKAAFTVMNSHMGRIFAQSASHRRRTCRSFSRAHKRLSRCRSFRGTHSHPVPKWWRTRGRYLRYSRTKQRPKILAQKMQEEVVKLNAVAKTGDDAAAIRTQFNVVCQDLR